MYISEVSLSSSLVTKFLSNIGISVKNVVIKLLPCEFGKEHTDLENLPTLIVRLDHFTFEKQERELKRTESFENTEGEKLEQKLSETITTQSEPNSSEVPIPDMLNILKRKVVRLGQISVHLLSSPFGTEMHKDESKWAGLEFPYTFPPIRHLSTLL